MSNNDGNENSSPWGGDTADWGTNPAEPVAAPEPDPENIDPTSFSTNPFNGGDTPEDSPKKSGLGFKISTAALAVVAVGLGGFYIFQNQGWSQERADFEQRVDTLENSNSDLEDEVDELNAAADSSQGALSSENSDLRYALQGFNPCGLTDYGTRIGPAQLEIGPSDSDDMSQFGLGCRYGETSSGPITLVVAAGTFQSLDVGEDVFPDWGEGFGRAYGDDNIYIWVTQEIASSISEANEIITDVKRQLDQDRLSMNA